MANHRCNARRSGNNTGVVNITQNPAQQRRNDDGNQYRSMNVTGSENSDNKEAENPQQHAVGGQVADAHQGVFICDNHAGIFQPHHADKQPNTAGDPHAQADGNIGDHPVAYAENSQQQQTNGAPENSPHPHLPRQPHRLDDDKGEEGIQPHCRRQRNRQVSKQPHQNTTEGGDKTGRHKDSAGIHTRYAKNLWVNENNVDHCQKGGETCYRFGTCRRAVFT